MMFEDERDSGSGHGKTRAPHGLERLMCTGGVAVTVIAALLLVATGHQKAGVGGPLHHASFRLAPGNNPWAVDHADQLQQVGPGGDQAAAAQLDGPAAKAVADTYFHRPQDAKRWPAVAKAVCPHSWSSAIGKQLANWKQGPGITRDALDRYCQRKSMQISIVDHTIRVAHFSFTMSGAQRIICMLWILHVTILRAEAIGRRIPDLELVAQTSDGAQSTVKETLLWDDPGPLFGSTKCGGDASISFPMSYHDQFGARASGAMSLKMFEEKIEELDHLGPQRHQWVGKEPKLFFSAGKGTGRGAASKRGHREQLFAVKSDLTEIVRESHPLEKYATYKYLVYAYGRCGWSRRLHELAFMEVVVFMETSSCSEFYMGALTPGVDYVPVKEDFSDLAEKLAEMHAHPVRAAKMAKSWVSKARGLFTLPCLLDYTEGLLKGYAKLQDFKPKLRKGWLPYDIRSSDAHTVKFFHTPTNDTTTCSKYKVPEGKGKPMLTC